MLTREKFKSLLPKSLFWAIRPIFQFWYLAYSYLNDYIRYWKYSGSRNYSGSRIKLEAIIIMRYHIVEKGLTMPSPKLGFGKEKIPLLCDFCDRYILKFGLSSSIHVQHAVGVLKEYLEFHKKRDFKVPAQLHNRIAQTLELATEMNISASVQERSTRVDYFKYHNSPFDVFSKSRRSIRNYSNTEIPIEMIKLAIQNTLNTPSACNRQTTKVYVYTQKEQIKQILHVQGGAGGFGHLADKLLVVAAELGVFGGAHERYQAYVDGGMYAMNLLYALHFNSIAACILNCSNAPSKDKKLRNLCGIKASEVFIAMISCGIPPDEFSIATSRRSGLERVAVIK